MSMDGVRLAVFHNRLEGIARKMANTLLRTGRSGVLNIARDFSCCIVTADCDLLAAAESLPIHVLSGPDMMCRWLKVFHPELRRGDAFLHNSPYHGNSHAADHVLLVPVVDEAGAHRFTLVVKAHQADIGNSIPTTYHGSAADVYEEGALIFAATQVQRDHHDIDDIIRMCRLRIRVPDQWWGDYLAMVGAARIGEREMRAFAGEVGWDALDAFSVAWLDYAERRMVAAIRAMPAGRAQRTSTHDHFPGTPESGAPVTAKVEVDPEAARITVDMTDNIDCLPCGLNLSEACARSAAMVGVFNSLDPEVPKNAGAFRRLDIRLRENCIVGIPQHPTSTSVATTNIADRVANAVQSALAELGEGEGMAECGAIIPPGTGVVPGLDPRTGTRFVNQLFLGLTGGAGGPHNDAWQTIGHVGNGGLVFIDSVELDELRQPIQVH
jgi:N-methylhydantoinase B